MDTESPLNPPATEGRATVPCSVVLGACPRRQWYQEKGKSLRRAGWRLRREGPKWDAKSALIERADNGTEEWREHGIDLIADLNEQIQRHRKLGRDAANAGDRENAWYADKMIVQLQRWKAETEATLAKYPPND